MDRNGASRRGSLSFTVVDGSSDDTVLDAGAGADSGGSVDGAIDQTTPAQVIPSDRMAALCRDTVRRWLVRCACSTLACAAAAPPRPIVSRPASVRRRPGADDRFGLAQLVGSRARHARADPALEAPYPELQVVMVVDDLPLKAWNVAVKALAVPGVARRSAGLRRSTAAWTDP